MLSDSHSFIHSARQQPSAAAAFAPTVVNAYCNMQTYKMQGNIKVTLEPPRGMKCWNRDIHNHNHGRSFTIPFLSRAVFLVARIPSTLVYSTPHCGVPPPRRYISGESCPVWASLQVRRFFFKRNFPNKLFAVPLRTRVHLYIFKRRTHLRISCYLHSEGTQRTARRIFSSSTRQYNRSALTLGSSVAWLATNINGFHDPANSFRTLRTTTNEWEEERTIWRISIRIWIRIP